MAYGGDGSDIEEIKSRSPPMIEGGIGSDNDIVLFSDNKLNSESANTIFINENNKKKSIRIDFFYLN